MMIFHQMRHGRQDNHGMMILRKSPYGIHAFEGRITTPPTAPGDRSKARPKCECIARPNTAKPCSFQLCAKLLLKQQGSLGSVMLVLC
jgi:hypothetical protein